MIFTHLANLKIKCRVVPEGITHTLKLTKCFNRGFPRGVKLVWFKVTVLESIDRHKTLTVQETSSDQGAVTIYTTTSKAGMIMVLKLAEKVIAERIADLTEKLSKQESSVVQSSVDQEPPVSADTDNTAP